MTPFAEPDDCAAVVPGALFTLRRRVDGGLCLPYASQRLVEVAGLRPEALADDAAALLSAMPAADRERFVADMERSARLGRPWRAEYRVGHPLRSEVRIGWQAEPVTDADEVVWHGFLHVVDRDRTELPARLPLQDSLLKALSDAGIQQMVIEEGRIVYVGNRPLAHEFGFTDAAIDACPPLESIIHPDERARVIDYHRRRLAGEPVPDTYEVGLTTLSGERREFEVCVVGVPGSQPPRVISVGKDVTARKRAERQMALLELTINQSRDAVFLADETLAFRYVNDAACRSLGYAREELLGKTPLEIDPDITRSGLEGMMQRLQVDGSLVVESRHRARDGRIFPVELGMSYVEFAGDRIILAIVRDISERKETQARLQRSESELRRLAARRDKLLEDERRRLAYEMHEQIGQILAALRLRLGESRAMADVSERDRLIRDVREMTEEAIRRIRNLVTSIRPTTIEMGIVPALEWLVSDFAKGTAIPCRLVVSGNTPALGDIQTTAVFRVVQEALTNVALHAAASRVEVEFRGGDDHCILTVADDGRGIRAESVSSPDLGIVGMREQVAMLGGTFRIERGEDGQGTVIRVAFPVAAGKQVRE